MNQLFCSPICAKTPYSTSRSTIVNLTVVAGISGVTVALITILPWHAFAMHHAWLVVAEIHGGNCAWSYTTSESARTTWKFRKNIWHAIYYLCKWYTRLHTCDCESTEERSKKKKKYACDSSLRKCAVTQILERILQAATIQRELYRNNLINFGSITLTQHYWEARLSSGILWNIRRFRLILA